MFDPDEFSEPSGRYHKVALKNVQVWEPCRDEESEDWLSSLEVSSNNPKPYPIRRKHLYPSSIDRLHVIVQPDGALWLEGCLYLFWCHCVKGLHHFTISNAAGDLSHMMNKLLEGGRDYNIFRGLVIERPTYFYKSQLKIEISNGTIKRKPANRKISNAVNFYRWKVIERDFKPEEEMWKSIIKHRRFTDEYGVTQIQEIISTDLSFKVKDSIATGRFLRDGGRLFPIDRENQNNLLNALTELQNTEMLLAHIVSITTGMRMQSSLTLRHDNIVHGIGSDNDPRKFDLHYIEMGEGTLVEAKNGKQQSVAMPAWVHNLLHIYINSKRHKERAMKSPITDDNAQYVFLTRTGRPYYVAGLDRKLFNYSAEAGSALRQFIKKVMDKLAQANTPLSYSFHDLRATFGMNLLEDYMKQIKDGKMNQIELLDKLRRRLNHEDVNVTLAYLKYRDEHPLLAQAQDEFEIHLETLIRSEMNKHEQQRARNSLP
jgi:integrase